MAEGKRESWRAVDEECWPFGVRVEDATGELVVLIGPANYSTGDLSRADVLARDPRNAEVFARAALIAAAPDLLDVTRELMDYLQTVFGLVSLPGDDWIAEMDNADGGRDLACKAVAAIAKAQP